MEITNNSNIGKKNVYVCKDCTKSVVTIDKDSGVTPFMICCDYCNGTAESQWYNVKQTLTPEKEWYRPDKEELKTLSEDEIEHVNKGGLLLRVVN